MAYDDGYAQGESDRVSGFDYAPEEDDEEYEWGYADGWDAAEDQAQ